MARLQNLTSENILIGGIMNDLDAFLSLPELKPDYFSLRSNRILLIALKLLFKEGVKDADIIDIYAMCERNEANKKIIDDCGGIDHIDMLKSIAEGMTAEELVIHAENVINCAFKNEMHSLLSGMAHVVEDDSKDIGMSEINKMVETELLGLRNKYSQLNKIEKLGSRLDKIRDEIEHEQQGGIYGIPTFSSTLNKFVTYEKGELLIISAWAKTGKSQWIVNEVYRLAIVQKIPVVVLDTELSDKFFTVRLVARITGYNFNYIKTGKYKENETATDKVNEAYHMIANSPIFHQYIVGWDHMAIENEVKRLKIQENIQVLFFDYLKIEDAGRGNSEYQELGNLTNFLKNNIAGKLKIAVVAFAQQSDYTDNGMRIADSARVKNYASCVMFMIPKKDEQYQRDFQDLGGNYYLFIAFNRSGPQMSQEHNDMGINISVNKSNATFTEAKYQRDEILVLLKEYQE